jgi:hypothetical protein
VLYVVQGDLHSIERIDSKVELMIAPVHGCPVYNFKPRITFGNDLLLPVSLYGIQIPPGLSPSGVPAPNFVTPAVMVSMLRTPQSHHRTGLGVTHGLTTADFAVSFSNMAQQWRQIREGRSAPFWQFYGGDVYLDVTITVYVLDGDRPQPKDDLSSRLFAVIMGHELLHVLDEIEIISKWMPSNVVRDDMVLKYLSNAQPVDDAMFRSWFQGNGFSNWLKDGIWAPEHNRRGALRDSPAQYRLLQHQIDDLRIKMTNRPSP